MLESRLADPSLYGRKPEEIVALQRRLKETEAAISKAEATWFSGQEELAARRAAS
mgnify:CR=1 FL=1